MGYESKLYFVTRCEGIRDYKYKEYWASITEAMFDLDKLGHSAEAHDFLNLFDTETDFTISEMDVDSKGNEIYTSRINDQYGNHICYGNITALRKAAEKSAAKEAYWKIQALVNILKAFEPYQDRIYCVHWGY